MTLPSLHNAGSGDRSAGCCWKASKTLTAGHIVTQRVESGSIIRQ